MKRKVLLIVPSLVSGGGQKLVVDIASNLNSSKFKVSVLSLYQKEGNIFEKELEKRDIEVIYLSKVRGLDLKIIKKIYIYMKRFNPDVIHTHLYVVPYILVPTILLGIKIKIHTIHTLAWREATGIRRKIMGFAYRFFGFTPVAISDFNKVSVIEEYKLSDDKVKCIYNGIDTKRFYPMKNIKKYDSEKIRFISVGRFEEVKNHKLMIEAFDKVYKDYKNIELVLVGDGYLKEELIKIIENKGLDKNIIFTGITDKVEVELNKSDIYLMSSDVEGLPLSVLEAMSCELPIVTTNAGGVIDIVKDGYNGLVTSVGDSESLSKSMEILVLDIDLRLKMGRNSRKMAIGLDIHNCVKEYEKLYEGDSI